MNERFLKARIASALYEQLQTRAAVDGKRLGTYVREALERDTEAIDTAQTLARIESILAQRQDAQAAPTLDHEIRQLLLETRMIVRELALASNAQILARVAAQLKRASI